MKKLLAIVLAMVMVLSLAACASKPADNTKPSDTKSTDNTTKATEPKTTDAAKTDVTIELWTYPVGNWGNEAEVAKLTDAFTAETGIKVKVEYLAYADGDDKINAALTAGKAPDLVLEGPERLVANWLHGRSEGYAGRYIPQGDPARLPDRLHRHRRFRLRVSSGHDRTLHGHQPGRLQGSRR